MRNLTKTIVAVSLMTSTSAYSLGIGEIKLRSALNQNLDAEIALFASAGENVSDIRVKLASPAKFDAAGVPWSYFLSKIRFTPITKPDGSIIVKMTSSEALKEPYLNFLLEVSWPNGNQYREFTVLVDPPNAYKQKAVPLPAIQEYRRPDARMVTPEEYTGRQSVMSAPAAESNDEPLTEIPKITEYGPVRRSDTLWSISNKVRPEDVTTAQMAVAIFDANPNAFVKPNMNTLRPGKMLSIPEPEVALQTPPAKALAEFKRHRIIYRAELRKAQAARRAALRPPEPVLPKDKPEEVKPAETPEAAVVEQPVAIAEKPPVETPEKTDASQKPAVEAEAEAKPTQQLKLEPPAESAIVDKDAAGNGGNKQNSAPDDAAIASMTAARRQEMAKEEQELDQRFQRIEQQLVAMQKLLEIKNEQLANIQNSNLQVAPQITSKALNDVAPAVTAPDSLDAASVPPPSPKPAIPMPAPAAVTPDNSASTNIFNDSYIVAGGFGALLISALGFLWWRKRQEVYEEDLDDLFATPSEMELNSHHGEHHNAMNKAQDIPYDLGMVSESAFLSEFTPSEFDAFDAGQTEIDPISEADVYLAYGRYQQAEDLMRQAIADQPERNECKLKLLEIFYVNENKASFDTYVHELMQQGKQNEPEFWNKVLEMANVLNPGTEDLLKPAPTTAASENKSHLDFDVSAFSATDVAPTYLAAEHAMEQPSSLAETVQEPILEPEKNNSSLEFDLSILKQDKTVPASDTQEVKNDDPDHNALDFDLSMFLSKEDSSTPIADIAPPVKDRNDLDFNLEQFDVQPNQIEALEAEDISGDQSLDFDLDALGVGEDDIQFDDGLNLSEDSAFEPLDFDFESLNDSSLSAEAELLSSVHAHEVNTSGTLPVKIDTPSFDTNRFDDLNDLALHTEDKENGEEEFSLENAEDSTLPEELENFEFDFSLDNFEETNSESDYALTTEQELGDFDFSLETMLGGEKTPSAPIDEAEGFDFDFSLPEATSPKATSKSSVFNVDDLTDSNGALDTKVNLANAYIDMGDIEAAKEIAEMLLQGSKEHKQAGREIMAKLS